MLTLSATQIPLKELKVTARQQLAGQDMSGSSAATDQAETGDKAKVLAVTGVLLYSQHHHLNQLYALAGAKENGERSVYRINNRTAEALKISQVKFQGTLTAQEDSSRQLWQVSFELVEYLSVAERTEKREPPKTATQQKVSGIETPQTASSPQTDAPPESEVEFTGVMGFLQSVDKALA